MTIPSALSETRVTLDDLWTLLETASAGTFHWEVDGDSVRWSPQLLATLGYAPDARARRADVDTLIHPDDAERVDRALRGSMETGARYAVDARLRHADGHYIHFAIRGHWIRDDAGSPRRLIGFLLDVSERETLRDTAERTEQMFRTFFDNAPASVYIKDRNFRHVYGNAAAARLAGCSPETFMQRATPELFDPETAAKLAEIDRAVLAGETRTWTGILRRGPKGDVHVHDVKFPIADPATGETMIGAFGIDISEQIRLERTVALGRRLEAIGQLTAGIAHDFNNSLAVMQGNLDLLRLGGSPADMEDCLSELENAVARGRRLTQQLLAYGRKAMLRTEVIDLNGVIAGAERLLRRTLPATMTIDVSLAPEPAQVRADRAEIENALLNLALNARDAMPEGGRLSVASRHVSIEESRPGEGETGRATGRHVAVTVADTGTGMSAETAERAFEPFFTTKGPSLGTGMGLASVYGMMRQLGGDAILDSTEGQGTTVTLLFPAVAAAAKVQPPGIADLPTGTEHVLLVEDEPAVRTAMRRQLARLGYSVTEAENGAAALDRLAADAGIALMITDVVMPGGLQGPQLADRAREIRPGLPVLFTSGYPMNAAGIVLGGEDTGYISKPASLSDLARAVRVRIDRARG